jgi:hypothetical protein
MFLKIQTPEKRDAKKVKKAEKSPTTDKSALIVKSGEVESADSPHNLLIASMNVAGLRAFVKVSSAVSLFQASRKIH